MEAASSLNQALEAGVPQESVALYARWWQFEGWLRQLAYFVLRSTWGAAWESEVNNRAAQYARRDNLVHLASPDTGELLSYLDFSLVLSLIEDEWDRFEPFLLHHKTWLGRSVEFQPIRNRIAHLRRPAKHDLSRVETTLADLEPGYRKTLRALCAAEVGDRPDDPVVQAYRRGPLHDIISTARRRYGEYALDVSLSVSSMPWASIPDQPSPLTGTPGMLWQLNFGGPDIWVWPQDFQEYIPTPARQALVYAFMPSPFGATFAAPTVDHADTAILALHDSLETFLYTARPLGNIGGDAEHWPGDLTGLDSRILVEHIFAVFDNLEKPGNIFHVH